MNNMFSNILKIALLPNGPFLVNITATGKVTITDGYETGLLEVLTKGLKRQYTLHVPKEHTWGAPTASGYWTGLVGMIDRGEADIAVGSVFISKARMSVVQFSNPYSYQDVIFATKVQKPMSKNEAFFQPFSDMLWVYIGIAFLSFLLLLRFHPHNKFTFARVVLLIFGILLRQAESLKSEKMYGRLVLMSWLFFSFFISYGYTGNLLSFLTIPTREHGIRTISELVKAVSKGRYKCTTVRGSIISQSLKNSGRERDNIIGQHILKNNFYIDLKEQEIEKYLNSGKTALITSRENVELNYHDDVNVSEDAFYSSPIAVAMKKDFPYQSQVERSLLRALNSGIYLKSFKDYVFRQKIKHMKSKSEIETDQQLSLKDLYAIFAFLVIGNTTAVFVCVGEIIFCYWSWRKLMKKKVVKNGI